MALLNYSEFEESLLPSSRLLGLDVGSKTVGIALSDTTRLIATPHKTLERKKLKIDLIALEQLVAQFHVGGIVVGLPINMNGTEGPRCQSVRQFALDLSTVIYIPICFWDERLSTMAVTRTLLEADMSRKRRGEVVDKMAASFILQGCLDRLRG